MGAALGLELAEGGPEVRNRYLEDDGYAVRVRGEETHTRVERSQIAWPAGRPKSRQYCR